MGAYTVHASTTIGTIDTTYKYAWSNVGGWVNFGATNGGITVTDTTLTGYAWSANDGWINLAPTQSGVTNDGAGNLSGFAWDQGAGWVNFSGVTINSSGKFTGTATGGTVNGASYAINFDCTNCDVRTDWRPSSSRTTTTTVTPAGSIGLFPPSQTIPPQTSPLTQNAAAHPPATASSIDTIGQKTSSWGPWLSASAYQQGVSKKPPASVRASTSARAAAESSGAKFIHAVAVPIFIVVVVLLLIFLPRFFL